MKILIADDDCDLVDWLSYSFRRDGYTVFTACDGEAAGRIFQTEAPDVVLLDLKMPKRKGLEVLQEIRRVSTIPVVLLTAVNDEETVVKGLEMGADDYIVKPFRPRELRARVAAVLRRSRELSEKPKRALTPLVCGDLKLDPRSRQVTVAERAVRLTPHEFGVLEYLMLNEGMVVRIHDILSNIWGFDADQDEHAVRVTIARLRQKIEPDPSHPRYVLNLPGEGYMVKTPG